MNKDKKRFQGPAIIENLTFEKDPGFISLRKEYLESLYEYAEFMRSTLERLEKEPERTDLLKNMHISTHQIVGSAGSYAYPDVSAAARVIESELRVQIEKELSVVLPGAIVNIRQFLDDLEETIKRADERTREVSESVGRRSTDRPVAVIGNSLKYAADELEAEGYNVRYFDSADEFINALDSFTPSAILHKIDERLEGSNELLRNLELANPQLAELPFLAVLSNDSMEQRLQAVKLGSGAIFAEPLDVQALFPYLVPARERCFEAEPMQLVVIEDDLKLQKLIQHALRPINCSVASCTTGNEVLTTLKRYKPDIILLDTMLPDMDGYDIYRMIQLDAKLQSIPIILMITEGDELERMQQWEIGANNYIIKPFSLQELRKRVRREMIRVRSHQHIATIDGLTGLKNREYFKELIKRETLRAERYKNQFSVVLIDIDNFATYNETAGVEAGDELLRSIGGTLRESVRSSDLVARIGGDEFGFLLLGVDNERSHELVERLREVVSDIEIDDIRSGITLSAVIYSYPLHYTVGDDIFATSYRILKRISHSEAGSTTIEPTN